MTTRTIHDLATGDVTADVLVGEEAPPTASLTTPAQVKAEAMRRILAAYPLWKQVNAALGLYDGARTNAITAYVNAVRLASDVIESRLAADPGLDPAVQPDWPEDV